MDKKRLTILTALTTVCLIATAAAKPDKVSGSGVGYGETKSNACEVALNNARSEAAQSSYTLVQSNFESIESNTGVKYKQDDKITSKAYARLLNKEESTVYIEESGQIKCNITASFKAFPITPNNIKNTKKLSLKDTYKPEDIITQEPVKQRTIELISGESFCLKYLGNSCYREYYDPETAQWGIQYLGFGIDGRGAFGITLKRLGLITNIEGNRVETKEDFIEWYQKEVDNLSNPMTVFGRGTGLQWSKKGYASYPTQIFIQGLSKSQVGYFSSDTDFEKESLIAINNILIKSLM